jgi:16S rRNA (guanine(527)-N(7))-methyltransferase RsmG
LILRRNTVNFEAFKQKTLDIFAKNKSLPTPTDDQIEKLFKLTEIMLEVNKSMNLTAITEESAVILKHYADSVSISSYIPEGAKVIDVGCGAGFPTLPLAIFRQDIEILGLDSTAKRIEYVKATANKLGLRNVSAIAARAEELANKPEYREKFDTESKDERNKFIANKAWAWAGYIFVLAAGCGTIVFKLLGREDLMMFCSVSVCFLMTAYWLCWLYLNKKY